MYRRPLILTNISFGLLGPLLGAALLLIWATVVSGSKSLPNTMEVTAVLGWAYALGALPAAFTGLLWGLFALRSSRERFLPLYARASVGALIGGVVGFGGGVILNAMSLEATALASSCAILGALAGGLLAMVFPSTHQSNTPSNNRIERAREP